MTSPDGERHLYLPSGRWIDFWTGEVHDGGRHLLVRTSLEHIPLFVRADSLIVMSPDLDTVPDGPFTDLTVTCWGGGSARTVVHDEAGRTTIALAREGGRAVVISEGLARIARVAFPHGSAGELPRKVLVDGVPAKREAGGELWTVQDAVPHR